MVAWYENKLDELGFVSTASEETRARLAPIMGECFSGTIDGQPITIKIYSLPPPPVGHRIYTPVVIMFYAKVD